MKHSNRFKELFNGAVKLLAKARVIKLSDIEPDLRIFVIEKEVNDIRNEMENVSRFREALLEFVGKTSNLLESEDKQEPKQRR